jgi:alpha-2-macroglobulin
MTINQNTRLRMFLSGILLIGSTVRIGISAAPYEYRPGDRGQYTRSDSRVRILPDRFLREYDPVTLFFSGQQNDGKTGPEDHPEKWVTMHPKQPGEYLWIDGKTLEFRPTVPWPPISTFTITADREKKTLKTLLSPPQTITPAQSSTDLSDVNKISLEFAYPVAEKLLKKLVSFEVTPLPGIDRERSTFLTAADYRIKAGEQKSSGAVMYTFNFKKSFPLGHRIRTHVLLSDIPEFSEGKKVYWFDTKSDFRLLRAGTFATQLNIGSEGSHYSVDQALAVDQEGRIVLDFSSRPKEITLSEAKSLFTFSPAPRSFAFSQSGNRLVATVKIEPERLYKVHLQPVPLTDQLGRTVLMNKASSFYVFRNPDRRYIRWTSSYSILERFGPQHLPISLANIGAFDLRIYRIDPLHKAFFPFPQSAVSVSETKRPPGPGEEPENEEQLHDPLSASAIARHIQMLGSPHFSEVIDASGEKILSEQTIDLKRKLEKIAGKEAPGTYLVGYRDLSGDAVRHYVKVCVTDLCLSTVESKGEAVFFVTSLSKGNPVSGANVSIEGMKDNKFISLGSGETDNSGRCTFSGGAIYDKDEYVTMKRVVVKKGKDCLVLDCRDNQSPPEFVDNHWRDSRSGWLDLLTTRPYDFSKDFVVKGFVFPERPVYRPEEKVYLKGYIRSLAEGTIRKIPFGTVELHIRGPENEWKQKVTLSDEQSFDYVLDVEELITGEYQVSVNWEPGRKDYGRQTVATASFRVDAYRIPRFEVKLSGPDQVPNDKPFTTSLTASYYAGGKVIDCRTEWKVRTFPYTWMLKGWEEYALSSDSRFSRSRSSTDKGTITEDASTDDNGNARLVIQPDAALGANPAKYIIEATVTDVDQQTVTDVHSVVALPPFVLALKTDRYVTGSSSIRADLAAISSVSAKPIAGQEVKVALKKMSWHSYLQETDFARGEPRYITDENITLIEEQTVTTGSKTSELLFEDRDPGVYIIELNATDKLGRLQTLQLDLFLAGKKAVIWQKSQQKVFETVTDKEAYVPGDVARIVLKSPYQNGAALAVVETPDGKPEYSLVSVKNGQAEFTLPVDGTMAPRIPVSFLLMRPRISDIKRMPSGNYVDAGKPESVANTTWLTVKPTANRVTVALQHDKVQTPGDTMTLTLSLSDWKGKPLGGEVALWLVDEAVLALGEEMDLDPVSRFIPSVSTHLSFRDTRNLALGRLRDFENAGGDEAMDEGETDVPITVRKNFKTVPYYNPSLVVDKSGKLSVQIPLPDNLTRFAIRAVAVSGIKRFGVAKSKVAVRLPVIVQPSLPRFIRVGDRFSAGGVARIVEGEGGDGAYSVEMEGLQIAAKKEEKKWYDFTFPGKKAQPVYLDLKVPTPAYTRQGKPARDSVTFQMAVKKKGGKKGDAFRVSIPLLADRSPVTRKSLGMVKRDSLFIFEGITEKVRANTLVRQLLVSNELPLLAVLGGLRYLIEYPHGCTEQKISRAYPSLVYQDMWRQLGLEPLDPRLDAYIKETLVYLEKTQDGNGLFAYWPGGNGTVHLTAYAVEFLTTVKKYGGKSGAQYGFNGSVYSRALDALERSLRSDYTQFLDGYMYFERCAAIHALVLAGKTDMSYLNQLAYHSQEVDAVSQARIYTAILESNKPMKKELKDLEKVLWNHTVFKLRDGKEVYGGLQQGSSRIGAVVHGSEINGLAGLVGALSRKSDEPDKVRMMSNELVTLGGRNGWGNTHTNGLALLALHDRIAAKRENERDGKLLLTLDGNDKMLSYSGKKGMLQYAFSGQSSGKVRLAGPAAKDSFYVKLFERYLPTAPGSTIKARQEGFVVKRQIMYPSDSAGPTKKIWIDTAGQKVAIPLGKIVEEHVQVTNPDQRYFVAVVIPLAAGVEFLNPELKTASSEFTPEGKTTSRGSYAAFMDDRIVYYFNTMEKGTFDFYFRVRATTAGTFTQPPAQAEMMYKEETYGNSTGATVIVKAEK